MDFFRALDAIGLLEHHAQEVLTLEEEQAKKLLAIYRKVARRLNARLRHLPADMYTTQTVRVTLAQVEAAILALEGELTDAVRIGTQLLADKSLRHLHAEINAMNRHFKGALQPIDLDAVLVASERTSFLFNRYEASIQTYSQSLRQRIAEGVNQMVMERQTNEQIIERLQEERSIERFFEGEEWRLRRIVRTEMHSITGQSRLAGMEEAKEQIPGMMKTLYHPMDHRTGEDSEYVMSLDLKVPIDEPFEYTWTPTRADGSPGKPVHRRFMAPPDRPNDRSVLIPYHPSWE